MILLASKINAHSSKQEKWREVTKMQPTSMKGTEKWLDACTRATKGMWTKDERRIKSPEWITIKKQRMLAYKEWFSGHVTLEESINVLQVGPGPEGEIFFWKIGKRYAIDPLANFFKEKYREIIDPTVEFVEGKGEEMPYDDDYFHAILCTNVLDHVDDDVAVLKDIFRVLKTEKGFFILEVHVFSMLGHLIRRLHPDPGHPHNYTCKTLTQLVESVGFRIVETRHDRTWLSYVKDNQKPLAKLRRFILDSLIWRKRYNRYMVTK